MTDTVNTDGDTAGPPWIGLGATAAGAAAMAVLGWTVWHDLPAVIDNDTSGVGPRGEATPRGLLVAAMPLTLVGTGALFLVLAFLGLRTRPHLPAALRGSAHGTRMAADTVMGMMALMLTPLHAMVVLNASGQQVPVVLTVGLSVGSGLVLLGLVLPRIARLQHGEEGAALIFARTARPLGVAVAGVGVVQIVVAVVADEVFLATLPPLLLLPATAGAFAWPFLRHGLRLRGGER
ncbi:hypothetical protein [Nocardiopsis xinjiangensis]|uniref:hypothetical protein n=1 Tax=Nocardiopsis xinjiangensis TaxID=124285 RepID=UPI000349E6B9|nr:hypothetical protein [Nocardiopsis xinjiangensis]